MAGWTAEKIIISQDGDTLNATGILAYKTGLLAYNRKFELNPGGEILISAGAYGSPKLLMLSGIGPKEHLENVGVDTLVDLPAVGQNLVDTPVCPIVMFSTGPKPKTQIANGLEAYVHYFSDRALEAGDKVADMEYMCFDAQNIAKYTAPRIFSLPLQQRTCAGYFMEGLIAAGVRSFQCIFPCLTNAMFNRSDIIFVAQHNAKSTGSVELQSSSPAEDPIIDPKLLSDPADVEDLMEGMDNLYKILGNRNFQEYSRFEEYPGPRYCRMPWSHLKAPSKSFIKDNTIAHSHPTGTCRMGPVAGLTDLERKKLKDLGYRNPDTGTVLSSNLKVHGVNGLRVADASIIPRCNRGPTNSLCMAIGSKAAELILLDH
mmetsp:Transcript_14362/g.17739  ORF Transcript_14362/g.17739 Transcript_14362/m.17739 type:complete len:373 (+) Transcript_14362:176-1294(+)